MNKFLIVNVSFMIIVVGANRTEPLVETQYGKVAGERVPLDGGRNVDAFLGIPYAKPPVGALRFAKPQPAAPWNSTLTATKYGNRCMQTDFFPSADTPVQMNEDCLSLNVITPAWDPVDPKGFPVIFWVHGGGFQMGASYEVGYKGLATSIIAKNVILVSINYRLNVFGFFTTGDQTALGNYGLQDQAFALQWVHDNIHAFGGDNTIITVMGESAGSVSTDFLTLSPKSNTLFDRAISMSGTTSAPWAINPEVVSDCQGLAKELKCEQKNTTEQLQCLQGKTAEEVLATVTKLGNRIESQAFFRFSPRVDGEGGFLPKELNILRKEAPPKTVMTGTLEMEGVMFIADFGKASLHNFTVHADFGISHVDAFLESVFPKEKFNNAELLRKLTKYYYTAGIDVNNRTNLIIKYSQMVGDLWEVLPTYRDVQDMVSNNWTVYVYSFEYENPAAFSVYYPLKIATHGYELPFLFNAALYGAFTFTDQDKIMVETFSKIVTEFAKSKNPNLNNGTSIDWQPVVKGGGNHLVINEKLEISQAYHQPSIAFWTDIVTEVGKMCASDEPPRLFSMGMGPLG